MDAFAAALCKGLCLRKVTFKQARTVGLFFGGFQGLMPLIGWLLGRQFAGYIETYDHWIALLLLGFIGGKMLYDGIKKQEEAIACQRFISLKELTLLAVATSIDALVVGVTFAFLHTPIVPAISMIGITTLVLSIAGVYIGKAFGGKYQKKAEMVGGLVLVGLGIKIFVEHMFF
ncbi:MAG: manganese efflux pump [Clostridiales bacterium]|nr:manganese efflux pump [Clostridiales bacterium]